MATNKKTKPVNSDKDMAVTSVTDLQKYAKGTVVRFPDFAEGQPFVARVRRPSMLILAKSGKIPNNLLTTANDMFVNDFSDDMNDQELLPNMHDIMVVVCKAALKEPTYEELEEADMELSDDQLMSIYSYTQRGIDALKSFREEQEDN